MFLSQVGHGLGFTTSINVSIFDIPGMIAQRMSWSEQKWNQAFSYHICLQHGNFDNRHKQCYPGSGTKEYQYCHERKHQDFTCCNFWSKSFDLEPVMKVMRMAKRRANPLINITGLLSEQFSGHNSLM